jgi:hypothetical protein
MVKVKAGAKVITIEPAQNALTIGYVVKLFSAAFRQICGLQEVNGGFGETGEASWAVLSDHGSRVQGEAEGMVL